MRRTGRSAIDRYLLPAGPTAANPPHIAVAGEWNRQTDGQTSGRTDIRTDARTPYRFIDPAQHTLRAVPITVPVICLPRTSAPTWSRSGFSYWV